MLLLAILIGILAGFFASSHPDGFKRVSQDLKIGHKAASSPAVFIDYQLPAFPFPALSTAIAGIFGVILIFFVFRSIARVRLIGEIIKKLLNFRRQ